LKKLVEEEKVKIHCMFDLGPCKEKLYINSTGIGERVKRTEGIQRGTKQQECPAKESCP
jgi:hypothetical protein